ncbi:T9SS type A sorting domain-containing protein [Flavobacterium sp. J372]|uniref:T9SS type A sorting domain-containing protein n=1 Tax=Flavobacterium sp. J372 TaxID=2898436 RepID=UPI002151782E|nr:T9SS type A sorting domain-containing protein [Flavobacterium sp. J372]MCR5861253.1 T9SS type A sorting domain-containing protein [Flavobacterium sp. J372]
MRKLLLSLILPLTCFAQGYQNYFTGNATNSTAVPTNAKCFMGGGTMPGGAVNWILNKANGGDVVVLCTAFNNYSYLYNTGVTVNSVETIIPTSAEAGTSQYIIDKINNAELLILGEGNAWDFITYFRNTPVEDAINNHINVKSAPVAGIGAGMSVLGSVYYTGQYGHITSADALNNPLHTNMTVSFTDFLLPYGQYSMLYTESSFNSPDRRGRLVAVMAKLWGTLGLKIPAYGCNENTAMCIEPSGTVKVYGANPATDFAYFVTHNCHGSMAPPITFDVPFTWSANFGHKPLYVVKVPGTSNGANYFTMGDDDNNSGCTFEFWSVENGQLDVTSAPSGLCSGIVLGNSDISVKEIKAVPNPFNDFVEINNADGAVVSFYDITGKKLLESRESKINTSALASGLYIVHIAHKGNVTVKKMVKQ